VYFPIRKMCFFPSGLIVYFPIRKMCFFPSGKCVFSNPAKCSGRNSFPIRSVCVFSYPVRMGILPSGQYAYFPIRSICVFSDPVRKECVFSHFPSGQYVFPIRSDCAFSHKVKMCMFPFC
jgi:hypothetical protein